jgi:hypothetical protein
MKKLEYKFVGMRHTNTTEGWCVRAATNCNTHAADGYVIVNHMPAGKDYVVIVMAREKEEAQ